MFVSPIRERPFPRGRQGHCLQSSVTVARTTACLGYDPNNSHQQLWSGASVKMQSSSTITGLNNFPKHITSVLAAANQHPSNFSGDYGLIQIESPFFSCTFFFFFLSFVLESFKVAANICLCDSSAHNSSWFSDSSLQIVPLLCSPQTVGGNDVLYQAVCLIPAADSRAHLGVLQ